MWNLIHENRSEEANEILGKPPRWIIRRGIFIIFLIVITSLFFANIFKYPDTIKSQITLTTSNPPEKIEMKIDGKINKLYVKNQETVKKDQILASIQSPGNTKSLIYVANLIDTLSINYNDFKFPTESVGPLSLGRIENAYSLFEQSYLNYKLEKELQTNRLRVSVNQKQISLIEKRINLIEKQKKNENEKIKLIENDYKRNKILLDKGVISLQQFEKIELNYLQATLNLDNLNVSVSRLRENLNSIERTMLENNIDNKKNKMELLNNTIQSYEKLKTAIEEWEQFYLLKSSVNGIISFQKYWGENQYINTGEVVFSILPSDKKSLVGKIVIPAKNAGKIENGQKVLIKLHNYPYQEFGLINGSVKSVSLVPNNMGQYFVEVIIPGGKLLTSYNKDIFFDREMIGDAEIITKEFTILERLFLPVNELIKSKN